MLSVFIWGAMSAFSFGLFLTLPAGPTGTNYVVLVPGFISLTASILQASQFRNRSARTLTVATQTAFDDAMIERTEKIKHAKWDEQDQMLRHQSSRRRAAKR